MTGCRHHPAALPGADRPAPHSKHRLTSVCRRTSKKQGLHSQPSPLTGCGRQAALCCGPGLSPPHCRHCTPTGRICPPCLLMYPRHGSHRRAPVVGRRFHLPLLPAPQCEHASPCCSCRVSGTCCCCCADFCSLPELVIAARCRCCCLPLPLLVLPPPAAATACGRLARPPLPSTRSCWP